MKSDVLSFIGKRFGRLIILADAGNRYYGINKDQPKKVVLCICDCGNKKEILLSVIKKGESISCGCYKKIALTKRNTTHGMSHTPEHNCWSNIISKCTDINHKDFRYYGGRGISIAPEWLNDFNAFYKEVGARPTKEHTLDRFPNNDGNYEPGNVRWATRKEQANNRRTNRWLVLNGEKIQMKDLLLKLNVSGSNFRQYSKRHTESEAIIFFSKKINKNENFGSTITSNG